MIIYGAIIIPIITAILLWKLYKHEIVWWEILVPMAASLLLIIGSKCAIETVQVRSEEYWGSIVKETHYYEPWNEYIHRTCTRKVGKTTQTYDCSYVQYHPAQYDVTTTSGEYIGINEAEYLKLKSKFGNSSFVDMHRRYHTKDGDMYKSLWDGSKEKSVPATTIHSYENRVKAADASVFHFKKVTEKHVKDFDLQQYPPITNYFDMDAIIGDDNIPDVVSANKKLKYLNGKLGPTKEVRMFIVVFKNQPIDASFYQESYWEGINMNEIVVCIGINDLREVQWARVISWTHNEGLKIDIRRIVEGQDKLNLCELVDKSYPLIENGFIRRDFHEFDYLTVNPPVWAVILTYFLTIALNFGISRWAITNEHSETNNKHWRN